MKTTMQDAKSRCSSSFHGRELTVPAVIASVTALYVILSRYFLHLPLCTLHRLTGLYCPFCGATRAAHYFLEGRVAEAFAANPLVLFAVPLFLLYLIRPVPKWGWGVFIVAFVVFGIVRNIPAWPFCVLAP